MNKLEELIKEFCPNGVDYKKLGELGKFYGGLSGKSKNDFTNGNEKFITYKNVYANPSLNLDIEDKVKINPGERQNTLHYGDIIFTGSSETPDECGFSSVITTKTSEKLYLNSFCFFFRLDNQSILLPDFAKHLFRAESIRYQIGKTASGVTRYNVSKDKMKQVQIPLPALPVQREIVRVLDSFTLYSAELTAELTARRKQYEFYRDKLLNFDIRVQRKTIEEIAFFRRGSFPQPYTNGAFYGGVGAMPFVQVADVAESGFRLENATKQTISLLAQPKSVFVHAGTIICSLQGSIGRVAIAQYDCYVDRTLAIFESFKIPINKKYFAYSIDRKFNYEKNFARGSTIKTITKEEFSKFEIPVPPMEVQERIVRVLDNFDSLCNDLSAGLPAEIEKRQKQYEYYRDKLLSF